MVLILLSYYSTPIPPPPATAFTLPLGHELGDVVPICACSDSLAFLAQNILAGKSYKNCILRIVHPPITATFIIVVNSAMFLWYLESHDEV